MKIALVDIVDQNSKNLIYKDWAGNFGTRFIVGDSLPLKFLENAKRIGIKLPLISYGYLSGIFKKNGHNVRVYCNELPGSADIVFIHSSTVGFKQEIKLAQQIKARNKKTLVGIIGPFASNVPAVYEKVADFIIIGEPEDAVIKIAEGKIKPKGLITSSPILNLDSLPFPDWTPFPVQEFSYSPNITVKPFLPVLSSRGCPYGCNYCAYAANFKFRARSTQNVLEELAYLKKKFKIKGVFFRDPIFTCDSKRTEDIARGMIARKLDLRWACETRLDHLTIPLIDLLYEAGLRSVNVGVESFHDDILKKASRKPIAKEHQEKIIAYCDKKKIRVTAFYIFGIPGDTKENINDTIAYAVKLNTHVASFNISTPYPGTVFYDKVKNKIFDHDWEHYTSFTPVHYHENMSPEELIKLKERAYMKYYFRPRYVFKFIQRILWR